jgi:hypothetical protein
MSKRKLDIALLLVALLCGLLAIPSFADSQARIVRLSSVEGVVQVDRNTGQSLEEALLNLPITECMKLNTRKDGRAEIEFEDSSTLRVTPSTSIEFSQLSLRDSGSKLSTVKVQEGTAYVNFGGAKDDELTLNFGHEKLTLKQSAHLRVEMGDTDATVGVFKGNVQVESPSGEVTVGKKQSVTFDLTNKDRSELADNLEPDPYDSWDKQQDQYHQRYTASNSYNSYSPYAYGASDLNYYGSFANYPGYGM